MIEKPKKYKFNMKEIVGIFDIKKNQEETKAIERKKKEFLELFKSAKLAKYFKNDKHKKAGEFFNKKKNRVDMPKKITSFVLELKSINNNVSLRDRGLITLLAKSKIPFLNTVGAKYAVGSKDIELEKLYIESDNHFVLAELAHSANPEIAFGLSQNKKTSSRALHTLMRHTLENLWNKDRSLAFKTLINIINHSSAYRGTLTSLIYRTNNTRILSEIINSHKLTETMVSAIVVEHYRNDFILLAALKSSKANKKHFIFAAKNSKSKRVVEYLANSTYVEVIEALAVLNKAKDLLLKNPYITIRAIRFLILTNIRNLKFVRKALLHPKVKKHYSLWKEVIKTLHGKDLVNKFISGKNPELKLTIAKLFTHLVSDKIFKKLLNDPDKRISTVLKKHPDEKVRVRASELTEDLNYLMDRVTNDTSIKVKVIIAKRNNLTKEVENALLSNRNKLVYIALAQKQGKISTTTEEKLAKTGDEDILLALANRKFLKSDIVLKILARCRIKSVELMMLKKYKEVNIQKLIASNTQSHEVMITILQIGHMEARRQIASRDYEKQPGLLKSVVSGIIKDPQARVRVALLKNKTFLEKLWEVLKHKDKQVRNNPYFAALQKLRKDSSDLVRKKIEVMVNQLSKSQKGDIKNLQNFTKEESE